MGAYLSADGDGLAYAGAERRKEIRPHQGIFPGHTLQWPQRDGALMPKEEKGGPVQDEPDGLRDLYDDLKN